MPNGPNGEILTSIPHLRTWSALFLASGQSRAVPSALEERKLVSGALKSSGFHSAVITYSKPILSLIRTIGRKAREFSEGET